MRFAAAFLTMLLVAPAAAFTAQNGLIVRHQGAHDFTIAWRGPGGASDFWCAAGDYAIRALRLGPTQMIYRVSEPPRRSGEAVRFSLLADDAASSTGLVMLLSSGSGVTAGHAQSLCEKERKRRR